MTSWQVGIAPLDQCVFGRATSSKGVQQASLLNAPEIRKDRQTLKRKCITSPSLTMYSLPSRRHLPASLAPLSPLYWMKSL